MSADVVIELSSWMTPYFDQHDTLSIGNLVWMVLNILQMRVHLNAKLASIAPLEQLEHGTDRRKRAVSYITSLFRQVAALDADKPPSPTARIHSSSVYFTISEATLPDVSLQRILQVLPCIRWMPDFEPVLDSDALVLHLRGGDILPGGHFAFLPFYIQPPLLFYMEAVQRHRSKYPGSAVHILCEMDHPYVRSLSAMPNTHIRAGCDAVDDFCMLMKSHHTVLSRGSFSLVASLVNIHAKQTIYSFTEIQDCVQSFDEWSSLDVRQWPCTVEAAETVSKQYCSIRGTPHELSTMLSTTLDLQWTVFNKKQD